jgi:hypothetical protein
VLKAQATTMKEWADAFFQRFKKTNETNKMSSGDFHTLMAKVESVGESLQKGAKIQHSKLKQKRLREGSDS